MPKLITAVYEVNRQDKTPPSPHTHTCTAHTHSCPREPIHAHSSCCARLCQWSPKPSYRGPKLILLWLSNSAVAWECALDKDCQVPNIASIRHTCERGMGLDGPVDIFHSCAHMLEHGIVLFLCGSSNAPCSKVLTPTYTHTGCIPDHGGICGEKTGMCGAPPGCQGRRDRQWPQSMRI